MVLAGAAALAVLAMGAEVTTVSTSEATVETEATGVEEVVW